MVMEKSPVVHVLDYNLLTPTASKYLYYFYKSLPSVKITNDKIIENTAIKGQKETSYDSK